MHFALVAERRGTGGRKEGRYVCIHIWKEGRRKGRKEGYQRRAKEWKKEGISRKERDTPSKEEKRYSKEGWKDIKGRNIETEEEEGKGGWV